MILLRPAVCRRGLPGAAVIIRPRSCDALGGHAVNSGLDTSLNQRFAGVALGIHKTLAAQIAAELDVQVDSVKVVHAGPYELSAF